MEQTEEFKKIVNVIKPYVRNEVAFKQINSSSRFIEDLKINSARLVDIILLLEDEFNISITDEEADKLQTMGSAEELMQKKLNTCCK